MAQNTITTKGVITINGKQVENTFNSLRTTTAKLEKELRKLTPGTQEFINQAEQVKKARTAFEKVKQEIQATTTEIKKGGGILNNFIEKLGGLGNAITFVGSLWGGWRGATALINNLLKISDAITDVQKTSGLAQKEVEGLWKEFGKFNTRTSRLELMNIAQIGGRLGITDKEQLQEFTREIDKIYVALGDSFQGGLEEVTTKVGKLKNLFDETKNSDYGTALNEIGSALNELGANGTASESNITDFATRIGQLPNALKPAIDRTLGLGAAFEESGIEAQIASSGYSRFMSVAGNNLEAFAQQMKITTEEATALFRTNPEEFFIKFGESLKGLSADQTAKALKTLDLNTLEVKKSLGAAGDNANRFREMMELSSKSMLEATSIQNEFNQKNENAAAVWEKMGRVVKEFLTDGVVPEFFNWITNIVGYITGIVSEAGDGMERFRARLSFLVKTLLVVTTATVSYRAAMWLVALATKEAWQQTILYNAATKVWHALTIAGRSVVLTLRVAFSLLTLQIGAAKKAMDSFNTATKLNPLGAIIAVITTAIVAYNAFKNKVDEAAESQKRANELQSAVNERMASEVQKVNDLVAVIKSEITSREAKERALKDLQEIAPEYFKTLDIEKIKTIEGKKAIDEYVKSLEKKYRTQVLQERMNANKSKLADMSKNKDVEVTFWQKMFNVGGSELDKDLEATYDQQMAKEKERAQEYLKQGYSLEKVEAFLQKRKETLNVLYAEKNAEMRKLKKSITEDEDEYKKLVEENPNLVLGDTSIDDDKNGKEKGDTEKIKNYTDNVSKKAQDELLKAERDLIKKQQELQDERTALLEDSLDKQISMVEVKYARKKLALQQENEDIQRSIEDLQAKIQEGEQKLKDPSVSAAEKSDIQGAIEAYQKTIAQKQSLIEQNNQREITLEETLQRELNVVRDKYSIQQIEKQTKDSEKRISRLKTEKELEIAEIKTLDEAKQKLEEQGYKGQLSKIKTLEDAKKQLKKQADKEIEKMTLESLEVQQQLLTDALKNASSETTEKLLEDLDKVKNGLVQVKNALNGDSEEQNINSVKGTEAENVDVLGFTAGQWEDVFNKLDTTEGRLKAVGMAMQSLANTGSMFAEAQRSANEKELRQFTAYQERRKKNLENQLNSGLITQEQYYNSVKQMEADAANKKAELEEKQFKAEKAGRLFSAIGSTAQAVAAALTAGPFMGPILAGIVGALGAVQIGIISAQQPPARQSYAQGGYTSGLGFADETGHEVAGVVHKNEYVIPEWLLKDPQVANIAQWLENRRMGAVASASNSNGYAEGGYTPQATSVIAGPQDETNPALTQALHRLADIMEKIDREGLEAFLIADAQNGKKMYDAIKKYEELKNKSKQ